MKNAGRIALAGLAGWLMVALVWFLGSNPLDFQDERAVIANMPQTQRDQLQRRFEHFQEMPADEQEKILAIHRSVSSDPVRAAVLDSYSEYVSHLDPWRRESLENMQDPSQRIAALQEMARSPERRRPDVRRPDWMSGETVRGVTFSAEAFQQILEKLIAELSTPVLAKGELGTIEWQLWAVGRLADRWRQDQIRSWPGNVETRAYLEQLPDERFRRFVLSDRFTDERRRQVFAAVLVRTLMVRWQRAWPERIAPGEIESVLPSLSEQDRRQFSWRDSSRIQSLIVEELAKRSDGVGDYAKGYQQVQQLFREFDEFGSGQMRGRPSNRSPRGSETDGGSSRRDGRRWSAFPPPPERGGRSPSDEPPPAPDAPGQE